MSTIAADQPKGISAEKPQGPSALLHSPAVVIALLTTLLGGILALVGTFFGPMVAQQLQNHGKRLEVRATLATDMSKSFTAAVGAGQRVASGLSYAPTGNRIRNAALAQAAYNAGYGRWQIDAGRIKTELSARYTGKGIVHEWALYRQAVTRFYRLSAVLPPTERPDLIQRIRKYLVRMRTTTWSADAVPVIGKKKWQALELNKRFSRSVAYRRAYDRLTVAFLGIGEAFVDEMLTLRPEV